MKRPLVLLVAAALAACGGPPGDLSRSLGLAVRSAPAGEVDLARVWPRPWDELYVFGPYSPREDNCRTLGLDRPTCLATIPGHVAEHEHLLVLRHEGVVTGVDRHPRADGDFSSPGARPPQPVRRGDAVWTVKARAGQVPARDWYVLEYKGASR